MHTLGTLIGKTLVSRYLILALDLFLCGLSFLLALHLRFNFEVPDRVWDSLPYSLLFVLGARAVAFVYFGTYSGIIKYTGERDARRLLYALAGSTVLIALAKTQQAHFGPSFFVPVSVLVIDFLLAFFLLASYKLGVKLLYQELREGMFSGRPQTQVAIYGAGRSGRITKRTIDADGTVNWRVAAFFDDDPRLWGKTLEGVRIYPNGPEFEQVARRAGIKRAIISVATLEPGRKEAFINRCLEANVEVLTVPPASRWLHGELNLGQLRHARIEDLLHRPQIVLESAELNAQIDGQVLMITGAAGSIGSEITRQLASRRPARLVLVDSAESPLVTLELELRERFGYEHIEAVVADVADAARMDHLMAAHRPRVIYHAAAYKHVPMMEHQPYAAVRVNVGGTRVLADLAVRHGVGAFVMVSTDKAVNPTNVMGASKRCAEIYTQALSEHLAQARPGATRFITTRFGNVLGSNGSVIPRFRQQIEAGGPVTVTHPEITRYFMTIPEACQLVLEAGAMGRGGEIYIFDMGKPMRIADLALKMIKLSGLVPGRDIELVYTGLRPGEKVYEELLADQESTLPTHHDKIMIAQVRPAPYAHVRAQIDELLALLTTHDAARIVKQLKAIVPEYRSQNSVYEALDTDPLEPTQQSTSQPSPQPTSLPVTAD